MEGRCDLILLGWTVFVGFNLVADLTHDHDSRGSTSFSSQLSDLYRGSYDIEANGFTVGQGELRTSMAIQKTGIPSARVSSMSFILLENSDDPARHVGIKMQPDLLLNAVEFGSAGRVAATGSTDPLQFRRFGSRACQLDAVVELGAKLNSNGVETSHKDDPSRFEGKDGLIHYPAIAGNVISLECGFTLKFKATAVDLVYMTQKIVYYSIFLNVLTILQIRCFLQQMRHTEDTHSSAKISVVCIAMQALADAYDSFLHLCLGLSFQYMFNTIAVVSLFKFVLFSFVEARYLLTIWRQRRADVFGQGWDVVRQELSWLYSRFYGLLVIGLVLICSNLNHLDAFALFFQAYWLPQIAHDAWQGCRVSALRPFFLFGISVSRLLPTLYLWGCPESIFSGDIYPRIARAPSYGYCGLVVLLQIGQISTLMLQRRWGPRWFIPWACMPQAYNYHRTAGHIEETDCVICMNPVDVEDARLRVVTPCSHAFHQECLEQWMDVKMECPTCRALLPPIT